LLLVLGHGRATEALQLLAVLQAVVFDSLVEVSKVKTKFNLKAVRDFARLNRGDLVEGLGGCLPTSLERIHLE